MDGFTPPVPDPSRSPHSRQLSDAPPPLPPPPTDLPSGYRASTISQRPSISADGMAGGKAQSRAKSRDETGSAGEGITTPDENLGEQRRGSFGFLSRTRSKKHEVPVVTSPNGHTMLRKQKLREQEERLLRQQSEARQAREAQPPPVIPSSSPLPVLNTFGGDDPRPDSIAIISNRASNFSRPYTAHSAMSPTTSMPVLHKQPSQQSSLAIVKETGHNGGAGAGECMDPRMDSMNSMRHHSVASTAVSNYHSPRRVRRKKDPTPFNILVIGAKSSGKTTLIDFLKSAVSLPPEKQHLSMVTPRMTTNDGAFTSHYVEAEFDGERVGLTLWDSQGFEKNLVDLQVREMVTFIESKFEDTFTEESKVNRAPGTRDTHIHCTFLLLDPSNLDHTLRAAKAQSNGNAFAQARGPTGLASELDMLVMKGLYSKTTVVPIISKADTLTKPHMEYLKRAVWNSIQAEKLDPLDALGLEEESDEEEAAAFSDSSADDHDPLPIQSTSSSMSGDHMHSRLDDSDLDSGQHDDAVADNKPRSAITTPSPGQPFKQRPLSRIAGRSTTPLGGAGGGISQGVDTDLEEMYIPFSLLSPDPYELNAIGRRFAWGMADPFNPEHCDFARLRDSVFSEWRAELRSASRERWYESWREQRLAVGKTRMRQAGGVTPTFAVPSQGRSGGATSALGGNAPEFARGQEHAHASQRPATSAGTMRVGAATGY